MSRFIRRCLVACSFLLILTACQNTAQLSSETARAEFALAEAVFAHHLAEQELDLAGQQLQGLRDSHPDEQRVDLLQQQLATAWLEAGEQALQNSDVEAASAALIQAKRLLPQAPALIEGLSAAIAAAQAPVVEPVAPVQPPPPRKKPATKKLPVTKEKAEPEPVLQQPEPEPEAPPAETVEPPVEPPRSKAKSRLIDVNAAQTIVPMPMLSKRNDHQLGRLLDAVAADVVKFRAAVTIEVADTRDFNWVAALLLARVKKLDANFKPRLKEVTRSEQPAQLIIIPNQNL